MLTFILEVAAFLIVLGLVAKYVVPPVRKAMNDKEGQIKNAIESAHQARREAAELAERRRVALEAAEAEAAQIVAQGNEVAEQLRTEGQQRATEEYDRLVQAAHAEIELARQRARDEVMEEVAVIVLRAAERVIEAGIDDERHRALVEEAIAAARAGGNGS